MSAAILLLFLAAATPCQAEDSTRDPGRFDGMSAIDIAVAAAMEQQSREPQRTVGAAVSAPADAAHGTESPFIISRFDIVEIKGRPGHQGEFPIPGEPRPGPAVGLAQFSGPVEEVQFRLETENGGLIGYIDLQAPEGTPLGMDFLGEFTVPDEPFRLAATGTDFNGLTFDLRWEHLFTPQSLEVRFDPEIVIVGPGLTELHATVTNHGPAGTFAIDVTTDLGLDVSSDLAELELAAGASAAITVTLDVPAISSGVLDILVTATATSIVDSEMTNYGTVLVRIERFEKVFWDGFD